MRLRRRVAIPPAQCEGAETELATLGFGPDGADAYVRGSRVGAIFSMDPRQGRVHLRFRPTPGGTDIVLEVDSRLQVITATERAYWERELALVEHVVLGRGLPLVRAEHHAALATVENRAVTILASLPALGVCGGLLLAGWGWLAAWLAAGSALLLGLLFWVAWVRWRPLTDDERPE